MAVLPSVRTIVPIVRAVVRLGAVGTAVRLVGAAVAVRLIGNLSADICGVAVVELPEVAAATAVFIIVAGFTMHLAALTQSFSEQRLLLFQDRCQRH